jgi:putative addiction module killer protein
MTSPVEIRRYLTNNGVDIVGEWLAGLKDARARAKIITRIDRIAAGNFGDCKSLRGGLYELRIDWGPGYRVYYASVAEGCVCCFAEETSANSHPISSARWNI